MTEIKEKKCLVKKVITGARGQMKRVFPILQKYKKGIVGIVGILVFILLCAYCVNGRSSVGFVDVLQVREKASVYQGILANQQKYEEEWRNRFNAEKELLVKEDKALADKRSKTKVSTFKKKVDSFQKKVITFQQKYQMQYTQIMMATQVAVQQADQLALETMQQLGQEKGVDIIVPKQSVLYAADRVDLTEDFIRVFDGKKFAVQYPDPKTMPVSEQK